MVESLNALKSNTEVVDLQKNGTNTGTVDVNKDESIFDTVPETKESVEELQNKLDGITKKNGAVLKAWNNFKETVHLGSSKSKCDEVIEKYKNGEISFEEASKEMDEYALKQKKSLELASNIVAGVGAIAAAAFTGGASLAVTAAVGAGAGAIGKAGVKLSDRATNEIENDALDAKQIVKDGLSGAITGGIAVVTAGTNEAAFAEGGILNCMKSSAKTGIKTGAISGASNNIIECTFEDDVDFSAKDLAYDTVTGIAVGATVGAIMGGTNGVLRSHGALKTSVETDAASNAAYKVTNDRVRATAHALGQAAA